MMFTQAYFISDEWQEFVKDNPVIEITLSDGSKYEVARLRNGEDISAVDIYTDTGLETISIPHEHIAYFTRRQKSKHKNAGFGLPPPKIE